ncbi:protein SON isoform X2 [Sphaerodactylus townsendi]|uniref:protein SON isoform X2 n=1 Tax=Sphaerodactylus townsendi TaxID=933632 RepID=UPI0020276144|nr:protein SON isoform X2 [Sphaerodactylus townsendi]
MATNIEQIFRSFVVSKFREIQQQQLGSGKLGQPNGEIDSSEQVKSADDTIASIGVLQNDPLVQKIEQVLSEVLGAEPQYKPDAGQDTVKNKSRSAKRGIPDEVQDEIPRKKSKKDKKHKDKKKKKRKKEKKEKKYKKQSKESKLNYDHKGCEDIQPASCLNSKSLVLSAENMDVGSTSPLKHDSEWFMEKTVYENVNSSLSNSHDASNSDTSKLYASEEDSVLINIQELCEVQVTNEKELETDICQHTNLVVNIPVEDEFLNTAIEGDNTCVKEVEQAETGSALRTAENINVPENSPKFMTVELEDLETRVEFHSVEVKELDSLSESLDPEVLAQPESISLEKTECKLMKTHLETIVEAKDSVTTLGFLAMVVGKDFEATSEFLNKAKVKVSGSSSKDDAKGMRDELEQDSERIAMMKELEKTLRTESRLEKKDLEENSATEKEDSESISESDERKSIDASVEPETIRMGELKETQTPAIVIKLKDPLKYQKSVEPEMRDFRRMSELEVMKRADSRAHILDKKVETKNVDTAAESEEMDVRCLSGTTVCESEKEKWDNIPERMGLKNLRSPEFAGAVRVNYLEASLETAVEKKDDMVVSEDSEMAVEVKVSASTPRSEMTPETLKITKTQYLDFSKQGTVTDIGGETDINLKDLKKVPEQPSVTLKNLETVSEMQYLTGMKHVKNVLQSDVTTQGKDLESNLKPEGQREDKDLDAASESLHMIFTNYSEHSLELYTEPEATMEVKNSEKVPELLPMEDVNNSEALSPMEVKGLKTIESTTVVKLNDLEKKIEYLHRGVKNRGTESKALTDVKYLETYVQSEPGTKERDKKVPSYSVTGVKQKALDTAESLGKGQYDAETADWKIKSGCLSMKDTTEKEPSAEIKRPLFISESFQEVSILNSETAPEVDAIPGMQELKETGRYIPILEVDSPDTSAGLGMSALIDPKDASKLLNTAEDFESISGYQVVENLDSLQFANDQAINFDSQRALQVKYTVSSPKLLFSDELTNLQEKQKLEESTEAASFTTAPESPDTSGTELIVASESGEVHEVIDAEHCSKTIYMEQANSDNFLKSLYTMHLKGSKTISESKIMDAKNLEIEPEYSHREGIETEHFSEYESVASSQVLEISEESPKKNEMQESNTAFGSKTLTVLGLEVNSETLCAINIDNLEVVKKAHVAPTSLGMISTEGTRIPVSAMEDKDIKASETVKTKVEIKHLLASTTPVGIARETFHPIHVTDSKVSEASQMLETNLESVHKKEVNTKLDHEAVLSGSETFKKPKPVVGTSTTEGMLPVINIAEENKSGTDLKPKAALVEKYSESVSESNKVSATKDCDSALSLFMVDVKDSELRSDFLDAGQVKTLNTTVQFETTPEPLCVLELGNSDDVVEPVLTTEMKELGETLNCEVVLEAKHSGPTATNVITSELKPSESLCVLEISNSEGIIELTTPTYLSSAHLKPSDKTTEIETLDSNSEAPLKSGMDVKYFESVSKSDCVLEQFHYKTVPESEYVLEEKVSETSELVSMKHMEAIPEPKHAQETKDLEPLAQSVCVAQATCVEKNIVYAEVRDVSETTPKFSGIIEIKDLGATMSSVLAEMEKKSDENLLLYFEEKCSETATECVQMPDLMETSADVESVCRIEGNYAEMACVIDNENSKANSGLTGVTELKDTAFVKSKTGPEPGHLKDLEAVPNSESLGKVKDMQIAQSSIDKKEGMYFEGSSESVLILERQDLERDSTSVLGSEVVSEESLKSVPAVKAKDSEVALKYIDAKGVEISEQNAKYVCMGEMKDLPSVLEHVELAQAKSSETFSEGTLEVKNLEAAMCLAKEKKSEATVLASLEEQILKASLEPICGAEKNNLVVSQQVMREMKDSEAASESVNMLEKEASSCISLKDQHSEAVPESSEITKKNDESISKDRKSEKVSSKSKDKSKSGKKTKKSRSKSPSKSKKRKKKSRSRSTSRQMSSRRARSRSKNDSDSRKKHSTSRRRSRSNSAEKKESKEKSLRTRRRRSRTSDRHKSRSKSVDKRETSLWSRRRHSRSSDRRKSRSRSIDRRESIRTRRRLSRSSDNRKSRSKSYDRREILIRSRRRLSRSSDRHKSRSRSTDKRETSIRTRRRRSRSSEYHKSRSRSVEKRETSVRRRRRRSRSSDNYKSRSKSVDRRESSVRSRRRRSRSSDHHKSRSRSVDDKREISVRTRRKRSRSSENRRSQSKSVEKRESLRPRRRRSRSSDNRKSRSKSGDKETPRTRRRRSRSSDNRKTRSESVDKRESSVRARRRRSRSSDRKSRSKSVDKRESSVRAKRRRSRSSDNKSRSKSVDRRETSTRAKDRRSRSSDNRKSRSKSVDKRETSTRAKRRRSRSCDNRKSRSKSVDKRESSVRARRRRSRSSDNRKSRSKSFDKRETSARSKRKRSRSSENCKSRSKSVDKTDVSGSSKRRRSKSSDHKPVTKASDKRDSSSKSGLRRSKSLDRQKSKSKSRSKSSERKKDKDSSDVTKGKGSKSRSKSKSPEKTEGTEVSEATVHSHAKSPEHPKSKSRSRSKSLDKTRDRPRRSRSKCSEPKSHSHRTVSRSRRNRSRSLTRKRTSRSKSDNRSHSRSRSRSCSRRWRRSRSRSVSRHRSLSRERRRRSRRNRSRSVDRRRRRSDSRDSYRIPLRLRSRSRTPVQLRTTRSAGRRRSTSVSPDHRRSRSASRSPKRLTDLDKAQLLEIAKANAAAMCAKAGVPLPPSLMPVATPEKKEEKVTQKSAKETIMELTEKCKKIAQSQEDDVILNKPHVSDEEEEEHPFINHPFKLSEPKPIFFNLTTPTIKPAPPKNQVTLTKEFPVSSGSQHRKKEADSAYGEWVPVEKNKEENKDDVFPNPATLEPVDISSALSERTIAQKRLTENTFDLEAMCLLNRAQERIDAWAQLNSLPGQFTGSTGAQVLSSEQLSNSGPQAWIKKDQFLRAAPVTGGMGAQLMRKMGWREGEGLGKNKEGSREPILVDFKTDRKGLVAVGEKTQKRHGAFSGVKDLAGKHPISVLVEACNKRRWPPPTFVLVTDNGPDHRKCFLFKVMVNGVEHKPTFASPNKKLAKTTAATVALQALGIVPKELLVNATSFRSASHN